MKRAIHIFRRCLIFLCMFVPTVPACADGFSIPRGSKHEVRAVWLTTIGGLDWPRTYSHTAEGARRQQQELCNMLDCLRLAGINTVLFQTRIRGTVIYPSQYEPWDGCVSGVPGKSPGYDPLLFAVEECHKRGMEIQAWVVAVPVGRWNGYGCRALRNKSKDMLMTDGKEGFLDPANPKTAGYIARICSEITRKYDIDGIHLDYIRYPESMRLPASRRDARQNITRIVRSVHHAVKSEKPWVKMSCSPIGKRTDLTRYSSRGWNAEDKGCQDVALWMKEGLMDQIFPMMYFLGDNFFPFVADWVEHASGCTVVPGLGIYFLSPREGKWQLPDVTRQMYTLRSLGQGFAMFRSRFLTDNTRGLYDFVRTFNARASLVPPMSGVASEPPLPPVSIKVTAKGGYDVVEWGGGTDRSGAPYLTYNVYASATVPVDTDNPDNLVACRQTGQRIAVKRSGGSVRYYAVTAADRYGRESSPCSQSQPLPSSLPLTLIANDGSRLELPSKGNVLDAPYILLETLQGCTVATLPYKGSYADITAVPDGMYVLRSVNRRGISHRLGYTLIKRNAGGI